MYYAICCSTDLAFMETERSAAETAWHMAQLRGSATVTAFHWWSGACLEVRPGGDFREIETAIEYLDSAHGEPPQGRYGDMVYTVPEGGLW